MSGKIPREFIDDLLVRVDIVDLIDSHVPLKKTGSSYVARCPFHTEKSPSFSVNRKKQFYHCFGCGEGGDVIRFLEQYSHLNFVEAIEDLALFAGIEVPREKNNYSVAKNTQNLSVTYDVLERVAIYYSKQLRVSSERDVVVGYLKNRGVSGDLARRFALGYAPKQQEQLQQEFNQKELIAAGLLIATESGRTYNPFSGRLIFPIRDKRKRVVGFGGRVLDDSLPKYRNSPETAAFSKSREVYGLSELLEIESKPSYILVVEGYMDVIALSQFGVNNAVATLGTATTKNHLNLLFRFTPELVFCFDGDDAGRKAAWRAMEIAFPSLNGRRQVKFMLLSQGQDPDSLIRSLGKKGFEDLLNDAQNLSAYFFSQLKQTLDLTTIEGKARVLQEGQGFLESMPEGFSRDMMLEGFKEVVGSVKLEISKNTKSVKRLKHTPLRVLIALLLQNPEFIEVLEEERLDWERMSFYGNDLQGVKLFRDVVDKIGEGRAKNAAVLRWAYQDTKWWDMVDMLANLMIKPDVRAPFDERAEFKATLLNVIRLGKKQFVDEQRPKK